MRQFGPDEIALHVTITEAHCDQGFFFGFAIFSVCFVTNDFTRTYSF
jgi:hypothetical protein